MFRGLITAAALAALTLAAPTYKRRLSVNSFSGNVVTDSYIVKLKSDASIESHTARTFSTLASSPITHRLDLINGYAGKFTKAQIDELLQQDDIEYVEQNGIMTIFEQQKDAPWGLQSISSTAPVGSSDTDALDYTYSFTSPAGKGVDIYIIDTGIRVTHEEFGGRATFGFAAGSYEKQDGNGHGTHCAGSAAGKTFGVAKDANLIAVKVLSDEGSGEIADIIEGIQFVVDQAKQTGRPTVASMSLGGGESGALDQSVASAIQAGIIFTIAAGNENQDAGATSPARVPGAITVGASNIANRKAEFSNFGKVVDIWAPGEDIISAWKDSDNATNKISGTSMATPHIAGLAAYLLGKNAQSPAALTETLLSLAVPDVLSGVPKGTINLLAFNGGEDGSEEPTGTEEPTETATGTELPTETETEAPFPTDTEEPLPTDTETEAPFPTETETDEEPFPTEDPFPTDTEEDPFPFPTDTEDPFPFRK